MDAREMRGLEIAARSRITQKGGVWMVPSQSDKGTYQVKKTPKGLRCTCPDFELRGLTCKHGYAVEIVMQRELFTETTPEGKTTTRITETAKVRISYPQNWPAYNQAQTQEKAVFCTLLRDLCATVPEPEQQNGRPRMPIADALFSAAFKVYSGVSSRRFATDLREAHEAGFVAKPYHFNSVLNVIEDETLTSTLYELVTASAAPLRAVESTFAIDSTGFGTQQFYRHFSAKYGHEKSSHDWIKLHAVIGTKTNVIAVAKVTDRYVNDTPQFAPLMKNAVENFDVAVITADKAYGSRANIALAAHLGTEPIIPLRHNVSLHQRGTPAGAAWTKLWHFYNYRREEFLTHYHARSNAESTFSSMKRVFGDTLRSKNRPAQINELLFKVIAHNLVCVIHSMFETGITLPGFSVCTQSPIPAQNGGSF